MKINGHPSISELIADPHAKPVVSADQEAINRRKILDFQEAMFQAKAQGALVECDFPLEHTFTEGAYARQMTIPRGSVIVGKIHRHAHLNFVMRGKCSVFTERGVKEIVAPAMFVSTPGTKRVVFAQEETVWVTVHVTEETDLEKIEDQIIAKDFSDLALPVAQSAAQQLLEGELK